ncbi:MAG TPA: MFS transporter [Planctomycetota bacterium]|nr:MFS transporter [Planctomycetota bacterium]
MLEAPDANDNRRRAMRVIWCFGLVSLFADMTYEGAHSVAGPFLKGLGASGKVVGFVAGFGEMIAASLRYFSGRFADKTRAYWTLAIAGYALNIIVVPALALAGNWPLAALFFTLERAGKALRGPSRDTLLSEATETVGHGWGFGIHAAMDQTGAVVGPLIVALMLWFNLGYSRVYLWLGVPAILTLFALIGARAAWMGRPKAPAPKPPQPIPGVFWPYIVAAGLFACGMVDFQLMAYHFSKSDFFDDKYIPLLYAGAMGVNGITAVIFGRLFDKFGIATLSCGILVALFSLPLAFLDGPAGAIGAVACWASGLGVQDACLRSGIAQVVSMSKRGSAFGTFNAVYGVAWFAGSAAMGALYDVSLVAMVAFGIAAQLAAAILFFSLRKPLAAARHL